MFSSLHSYPYEHWQWRQYFLKHSKCLPTNTCKVHSKLVTGTPRSTPMPNVLIFYLKAKPSIFTSACKRLHRLPLNGAKRFCQSAKRISSTCYRFTPSFPVTQFLNLPFYPVKVYTATSQNVANISFTGLHIFFGEIWTHIFCLHCLQLWRTLSVCLSCCRCDFIYNLNYILSILILQKCRVTGEYQDAPSLYDCGISETIV